MSSERPSLSRRTLLLGTAAALGAQAASAARIRTASAPRLPQFDIERFVEDCKSANRDTDHAQAAIQEVLSRALARPSAVMAALGEQKQGGIRTLYRSPELTVLNIVWSPLMQLMPHEHRMWSVIGIYSGREDNIFWQRREGSVAAVTATAVTTGNVVPLASDVIHSVANPIDKLTGAIHVYGGDFFAVHRSEWDPETLAERDWSVEGAVRIFEQSNQRFFGWQSRRECV
jgi:predicted metal-dependent enzyme (double-stranded beta helix superfamily)